MYIKGGKKKKKKKKVMTQCCYYCNLLLALAQPRKMDGREFSLLVLCMYVDVQMMMRVGGGDHHHRLATLESLWVGRGLGHFVLKHLFCGNFLGNST